MKTHILSVYATLFLLLSLSATAAADHIVVVGARAPASDVVLAANFAASMKATTGVVYRSALDTDVNLYSVDDDTVIVIDGKHATMYGVQDDVASAYFKEQGFRVTRGELQAQREPTPITQVEPSSEEPEVEMPITRPPAPVIVIEQQPELPTAEDEVPAVQTVRNQTATQEQGTFARFFAWLASIF